MATAPKKATAPATLPAAEPKEAREPPSVSPERIAEIRAAARASAEQARRDARKPVEMKPGTRVKLHITGWQHDTRPAEVVSDNMDRSNRLITARRLRGGVHPETATIRFENVSLWRE